MSAKERGVNVLVSNIVKTVLEPPDIQHIVEDSRGDWDALVSELALGHDDYLDLEARVDLEKRIRAALPKELHAAFMEYGAAAGLTARLERDAAYALGVAIGRVTAGRSTR